MLPLWTPSLLPPQFRMIATAAVIIATLAAAGYAGWKWRDYQASADELERQKAVSALLAQKAQKVAELSNALRAAERQAADERARLNDQRDKELKNVQTRKDRVIADLRADVVRLRDPWRRAGGDAAPRRSEAAATPGIVLPAGGAELSDELNEYLVAEASRADAIVVELNSCRRVAVQQHATCNRLLETLASGR